MDEDFSIYIHLFGWEGQRLGQRDTFPGRGDYPTSQWSPGQVIEDTFAVPVRADAAGPVAAELEVGLYRLRTMAPLPVTDPGGNEVGRPILARIKVAVPTPLRTPKTAIDADLDGRVRLLGYDLDTEGVEPGDELLLTLYWHVTGTLDRDYTVFIHLLDEEENIVGQADGPPLGNAYPTSFWEPGETLLDEHRLVWPPEAREGEFSLFVGLYEPGTWRRLPVLDTQGQPQGDRVLLGRLRVGEE